MRPKFKISNPKKDDEGERARMADFDLSAVHVSVEMIGRHVVRRDYVVTNL